MNRSTALEARAVGRTFYPGTPTAQVAGVVGDTVFSVIIFGPIAYGAYLAATGSFWTGLAIAAGWLFIGLPVLYIAGVAVTGKT
jgi:hypothetical protein